MPPLVKASHIHTYTVRQYPLELSNAVRRPRVIRCCTSEGSLTTHTAISFDLLMFMLNNLCLLLTYAFITLFILSAVYIRVISIFYLLPFYRSYVSLSRYVCSSGSFFFFGGGFFLSVFVSFSFFFRAHVLSLSCSFDFLHMRRIFPTPMMMT